MFVAIQFVVQLMQIFTQVINNGGFSENDVYFPFDISATAFIVLVALMVSHFEFN